MKLSTYFFLGFALLFACNGKQGGDQTMTRQEELKFKQYMVGGRQLYQQYCSNCHQENGEGLARLYPPLATSDFIDQRLNDVICLIPNGIEGEITVNGISYNQVMPGHPELTDLDVAEITTYIYNSWGREKGLIDVKQVRKYLSNCKN